MSFSFLTRWKFTDNCARPHIGIFISWEGMHDPNIIGKTHYARSGRRIGVLFARSNGWQRG